MKRTTTARRAQGGPDLRDLLDAVDKSPAAVEAEVGVSYATVYRALRGRMPHEANVRAIATAVRRTPEDTRAAIERSGKRARARGAA